MVYSRPLYSLFKYTLSPGARGCYVCLDYKAQLGDSARSLLALTYLCFILFCFILLDDV